MRGGMRAAALARAALTFRRKRMVDAPSFPISAPSISLSNAVISLKAGIQRVSDKIATRNQV